VGASRRSDGTLWAATATLSNDSSLGQPSRAFNPSERSRFLAGWLMIDLYANQDVQVREKPHGRASSLAGCSVRIENQRSASGCAPSKYAMAATQLTGLNNSASASLASRSPCSPSIWSTMFAQTRSHGTNTFSRATTTSARAAIAKLSN